ncbi:hypothetical protein [Chryseobacterium turcicum]|uniref:Uncharacterized protein n=1 Tax=Chryseobacterium turcicum TaxID=2898076 RepID=A0A9Q3V1N5_9FLAO|nr:hypothetical protein [Chryseobacterium turcicum]MCD1116221.1 hypothetical protein [Chryseobacterium turcicum]
MLSAFPENLLHAAAGFQYPPKVSCSVQRTSGELRNLPAACGRLSEDPEINFQPLLELSGKVIE